MLSLVGVACDDLTIERIKLPPANIHLRDMQAFPVGFALVVAVILFAESKQAKYSLYFGPSCMEKGLFNREEKISERYIKGRCSSHHLLCRWL